MQHKRLVIDANILIRCVLGSRAMQLVHDSVERVAFYIAEDNYHEAEYDLAQLAPERGIDELIWRTALESVMKAVQLIGQDELKDMKSEALARIGQRDADDWPA